MYAPSCVTWTVPEALGNMDNCQAGKKADLAKEIKSLYHNMNNNGGVIQVS